MTASDYMCLMPLIIIAAAPVIMMLALSVARSYLVFIHLPSLPGVLHFFNVAMRSLIPHPVGVVFIFDGSQVFFLA